MNKCIVCEKEFESKRSDKQTCSSTCRSKLSRDTSLSVAKEDYKLSVANLSVAESVERVMRGEPSGVDIGYGKDDYTREMVKERIKNVVDKKDVFTPNWYNIDPPFKSKNHFKKVVWKNI
jgi:hypothetical protein